MLSKNPSQKQRSFGENAQAIVEFAIVLPILLMVLVGILEVGRMIFIYAAVNNASREAVRYASAWGLRDDGVTEKFNDCTGIKDMATRSGFFVDLAITVAHDTGPGTTPSEYCGGAVDADDIAIKSSDRVTITVKAHYKPMVNLIPIPERDFESTSSRTIVGILNLATGAGSSSSVGGPSGGPTSTPTDTPTLAATATSTETATVTPTDIPGATATDTPTSTPTSTSTETPGSVYTLTPTSTPTFAYGDTSTPTSTSLPTNTPTLTPTFTPTFTPTSTSTPVAGCGSISTSSLQYNTVVPKSMSMTIINPHDTVTVASVTVVWNSASGGQKGQSTTQLALEKINLGGNFWTGTSTSGTLTIIPTGMTIAGNNRTSTIVFIFNDQYQNLSGSESITITLSTPGCEGVSLHNQ